MLYDSIKAQWPYLYIYGRDYLREKFHPETEIQDMHIPPAIILHNIIELNKLFE